MVDGSLDRKSGTPLHVQLAERLRQLIIRGEYRPGDRLVPEMELVGRFRLSRVTVRSGLALLERDGWILKRQGLGTFVCNPIEQDLTSVQTTSEVTRARGIQKAPRQGYRRNLIGMQLLNAEQLLLHRPPERFGDVSRRNSGAKA
jgi:DNA-binding GntR family transcriptional regulator